MTIDRQCSSGLMAIATAAKQIVVDRMDVVVAGGAGFDQLVQTPEMRIAPDPSLMAMHKHVYMPMLRPPRRSRERYGISRERQDEYALKSAAAHRRGAGRRPVRRRDRAGHDDDERSPTRRPARSRSSEVTIAKDEGNRADTTMEGLSSCKPVLGPDASITAGNASQLSDGSSACDPDGSRGSARGAASRRWDAISAWRSPAPSPTRWASARSTRCNKLLKRFGLKVDDIGLWELNEAFAVQVLYCAEQLGIPEDRLNVDGGVDLDRPSLRHERRADDRPRADRRQAPRRRNMSW